MVYADSFSDVSDQNIPREPLPRGGGDGPEPQDPPATQQGGPCDQTIRDIFADDNAEAAASCFEPTGFPDAWRTDRTVHGQVGFWQISGDT